jgi:hypothetical protein
MSKLSSKSETLKFLYQGISQEPGIDKEFFDLQSEKIDEQVIENACNSESFLLHLKPYLFDLLKRCSKFVDFLNMLKKSASDKKFQSESIRKTLRQINERDILCALIESISLKSQSQMGLLFAKNDYPVPLMYPKVDENCKSIIYKINYDILCLSHKHLAVVSGTKNAVKKGKSSLIPCLFPGLNKNSILQSSELSSVDVYCNDETNSEWIIVDFNGFQTIESEKLLKTFSALSTIHVCNVSIKDFGEDFRKISSEIEKLFNWYQQQQIYVGASQRY